MARNEWLCIANQSLRKTSDSPCWEVSGSQLQRQKWLRSLWYSPGVTGTQGPWQDLKEQLTLGTRWKIISAQETCAVLGPENGASNEKWGWKFALAQEAMKAAIYPVPGEAVLWEVWVHGLFQHSDGLRGADCYYLNFTEEKPKSKKGKERLPQLSKAFSKQLRSFSGWEKKGLCKWEPTIYCSLLASSRYLVDVRKILSKDYDRWFSRGWKVSLWSQPTKHASWACKIRKIPILAIHSENTQESGLRAHGCWSLCILRGHLGICVQRHNWLWLLLHRLGVGSPCSRKVWMNEFLSHARSWKIKKGCFVCLFVCFSFLVTLDMGGNVNQI